MAVPQVGKVMISTEGELAVDEYNCQLVWDLTSATATGAECEGCDLVLL